MNWKSLVSRAARIGVREGLKYFRESQARKDSRERDQTSSPTRPGGPFAGRSSTRGPDSGVGASYPGDFTGELTVSYCPDLDGDADPGEIVWGWIPFEEDHTQGKDRPCLVIGRDGTWVLVLMLTSQDHIPGGVGEVRQDRHARWMNIGAGDWDARGRPSEIRLDRIIRLDPHSIRREGAVVSPEVFEHVADHLGR